MPSSPDYVRDYTQETKTSLARGERPKNILRKRARRLMVKKGLVKPGQDVDHIDPLAHGIKSTSNDLSDLRAESAHKNRSYPRTATAGMKG